MVPLRLFRCKSLQHNEAHRGECQRTPQKMTRGKIHSQEVQRCELPNFSGNGSMQAVLPQSPTVKKKEDSPDILKWQYAKFTHSRVNDVGIPTSVGMVPLRTFWFKYLQPKKPTVNDTKTDNRAKFTYNAVNDLSIQIWGNGSTQAVLRQCPTAKEAQGVTETANNCNKQNSLTYSSKLSASLSQWEWFHSGYSETTIYSERCP